MLGTLRDVTNANVLGITSLGVLTTGANREVRRFRTPGIMPSLIWGMKVLRIRDSFGTIYPAPMDGAYLVSMRLITPGVTKRGVSTVGTLRDVTRAKVPGVAILPTVTTGILRLVTRDSKPGITLC